MPQYASQVILAFEEVPSRDPSGPHLIEIYVNPLVPRGSGSIW